VKLVFWGTPEFALPAFRALLGEGHDVVAVVTQPDRPAGRRRELRPPPVKVAAVAEMIPVMQPDRARGDGFLDWLRAQEAELNVVVAYGQILKREVLEAPTQGSVNLHASMLPELRGAAPIQWAIARGHETTGVTVMRMEERLDAGPILLQVPEPIGPEETGAELTSRLSEIGAEALVEALALLESGGLSETPQDDEQATYAPLITREHTRIEWTRSAIDIGRHVRAFDDVPGAWTSLHGEEMKLFRPAPEPDIMHRKPPGTVLDAEPANAPHGLLVACGAGAIRIRELKPAGRRRMTAADWIRGREIEPGVRFE
jgi:methionyl-tRNA formyltransferase